MPAIKKLVPNDFHLNVAKTFINELSNGDYYVYMGNHVNSSIIATPTDDINTTVIDTFRNMLFGKKIENDDLNLVIDRYDYESNTVYARYDDRDSNLLASQFYTIVPDGSNYHVFKCIDNNANTPSTVQPSRADAENSGDIFYPGDGYRWKWMYTANSDIVDRFATDDLFPVSTDANVSAAAITGSIDSIRIDNRGQRYDNYTTGTFSSTDLRLNGNTVIYAINALASSVNNFYNGCYLYITSGSGSGSYKRVVDYVVNNTTKYVILDSAFEEPPQVNWTYEISPAVLIRGDGTQSVNAVARAIINSNSTNSIFRIEMIDRGADYKFATANVYADPVVSVTIEAEVSPIHSPAGGHGSDAPRELGAYRVMLWSKFANNESNTIIATNDFSQIGIIKEPIFANVTIIATTSTEDFLSGENVYLIDPKLRPGIATTNATSNVVTIASADPTQFVEVSDWIYIASSTGQCLRTISAANSSSITISSVPEFDSSNAYVYSVTPKKVGVVVNSQSNTLYISNVETTIIDDDLLIGDVSGAISIIDQVKVNNQQKGFTTFVQMYRYDLDNINGVFEQDELVFQSNTNTANARIHSIESSGGIGVMFVTNQNIPFADGEYIFGADSDANARVVSKYSPDLVFGSGEILYIENSESIPRSDITSETFKLVFAF